MGTSTLDRELGVGVYKVDLWLWAGKPVANKQPHEDLANVRDDEAAVKAFLDRWVLNCEAEKAAQVTADLSQEFDYDVPGVTRFEYAVISYRKILRAAWEGDRSALFRIRCYASNLSLGAAEYSKRGQLVAEAELWPIICMLFIGDNANGKIAICENKKSCHSPYFIKSRRTQKYCADGWCTLEAKRAASRKSWNESGKKKREEARRKKRKEARNRRRQAR